ncbi:hypothetical protein FPV67DRAFT_787915 [Lyophyllum atratum]|nr:hypothetical protein FPV67DRAFT_361546 [Lyophyllum atratum]KAF8074113.1 hypothetical protein FPV67DRAFT_787915 [Lyophyllum atratum]
MTWPSFIPTAFNLVPSRGSCGDVKYYGPYNILLTLLFPADEGFIVAPQLQSTIYDVKDLFTTTIFTTIFFVVYYRSTPVLILTVKASKNIDNDGERERADMHMREAIREFCYPAIPTLYALSALGTSICVYNFDSESTAIYPVRILRLQDRYNVTAPKERWDLDVMSSEGEQRLREIATHVKAMCAQL